jgi:hypothetical protein
MCSVPRREQTIENWEWEPPPTPSGLIPFVILTSRTRVEAWRTEHFNEMG